MLPFNSLRESTHGCLLVVGLRWGFYRVPQICRALITPAPLGLVRFRLLLFGHDLSVRQKSVRGLLGKFRGEILANAAPRSFRSAEIWEGEPESLDFG